jgi:hypothetical protein
MKTERESLREDYEREFRKSMEKSGIDEAIKEITAALAHEVDAHATLQQQVRRIAEDLSKL